MTVAIKPKMLPSYIAKVNAIFEYGAEERT